MHGPAMSGWLLMVLCATAGAYCLARTRRCSGPVREAAGAEALMGFGMAAMAVPATVFTPPRWYWMVYAAVFGAAAGHAMRPLRRAGRHLHHFVGCLAMIYMAVAMAAGGPGGHGGHATGGVPVVTGALLVYFSVYALRSGPRLLIARAPAGGGALAIRTCPGSRTTLVPACRVSMAVAMLAMLLTL